MGAYISELEERIQSLEGTLAQAGLPSLVEDDLGLIKRVGRMLRK